MSARSTDTDLVDDVDAEFALECVGDAAVEALRSQRQGAVHEVNTGPHLVAGPNVESDVSRDRLGTPAFRNVPTLRDAAVVRVEIKGELVALERAVEEEFHGQLLALGAAGAHGSGRGSTACE